MRDDSVVRGSAQPRTGTIPRGGYDDRYVYYGSPWYSGGSHFGYLGLYSPFYYGRYGWGWGGLGYSYWHDPFLYDPYAYYGGPWPYYWGGSGGGSREERDRVEEATGSLRLKVNPRQAKVYVDGALAGVVDEFDGLTNHLRLPVGQHQIEFRADGYDTVSLAVNVERGKTRTERVNLKQR